MNFINKIELAGIVCGKPVLAPKGNRHLCSFTLVTEYAYHKGSEAVIEKNYHKVELWEGQAVSLDTLRKISPGCKVHVTGRERCRSYKTGEREVRENVVLASKFNLIRNAEPLQCERTL